MGQEQVQRLLSISPQSPSPSNVYCGCKGFHSCSTCRLALDDAVRAPRRRSSLSSLPLSQTVERGNDMASPHHTAGLLLTAHKASLTPSPPEAVQATLGSTGRPPSPCTPPPCLPVPGSGKERAGGFPPAPATTNFQTPYSAASSAPTSSATQPPASGIAALAPWPTLTSSEAVDFCLRATTLPVLR